MKPRTQTLSESRLANCQSPGSRQNGKRQPRRQPAATNETGKKHNLAPDASFELNRPAAVNGLLLKVAENRRNLEARTGRKCMKLFSQLNV